MHNEEFLGDLLVKTKLIDSAGLARAMELSQKDGISLGKAIATLSLGDEEAVCAALAQKLQLERLTPEDVESLSPDPSILPAGVCRKYLVVPLGIEGPTIRVAVINPLDYAIIQEIEFRTSKRVVTVLASQSSIQALLEKVYPPEAEVEQDITSLLTHDASGQVESTVEVDLEAADAAKLAKDTTLPPIVRLVNQLLSNAAKAGASDIHIEPKEDSFLVRLRVDGLLHETLKIPRQFQDSTISRLKIISGMDIAERRRPQDGRSRLRYEGKRIDLRVSTLPTQFGEKIVVRLLDSRRAQVTLDQLALTESNLRLFQSMLSRPQGMILVTGPTGSGKSSTLYTALNWVKKGSNNVITVEDPIECQLEGVNQVQINTKAGVTFAAGLRSILRQDPDVIFVGEIRDQETAGIALEAAQTGHLLLSTLHTNDAPGAVTRLLDLGVEPFLVASALVGVLGQRLVRKPCPVCASPQEPSQETFEKARELGVLPADAKWVMGRGCKDCRQFGYQGRLAVHELLLITDEIRSLISRRAPENEIRKAARNAGMRSLQEDALQKAAAGLTTLDEVIRVVARDDAQPISLPRRRDESLKTPVPIPNESVAITEPAPPAHPKEVATPAPGGKKRALVVEDSPTVGLVVKYFLELEGFEVMQAGDGSEGYDKAREIHPDVIVTDCQMPGMDGMEMIKALRADATTRDISILMLTTDGSVNKEARALEVGADDYIVKPVEPRRLAARVKSLLVRADDSRRSAVQ
ncbi:MAG TPA: ATPase, T2SS/T4P/T4SS family [Candidatus Acidoferrales bacterium]|nr:ATPase, T2SS/T4P/T4SS family [Candidatus Acidoferrales bacterium]